MSTIKKITNYILKKKSYPERDIKRKLSSLIKAKKNVTLLVSYKKFKWSGNAAVCELIKPTVKWVYKSTDPNSPEYDKKEKCRGTAVFSVKNFNEDFYELEFVLPLNDYNKNWWLIAGDL